MKELVVISGKGGTGKTSITAALAQILPNTVVADCDVDAANLHLLLKPKLVESHDFYSGKVAKIETKLCDNNGVCFKHCRFGAIKQEEGRYSVDPILCEGCGVCVALCPSKAISFDENLCGKWFQSDTPKGPMIHAELNPGGENSGKLVAMVRKQAKLIAEETKAHWILVDGPPGIGCPVISSITGSDAVMVVTEPTLSGKHDLERVLSLAKHFDIPASVVINKSDINPEVAEEISKAAIDAGAEVWGTIPYSNDFIEALTEGQTVIEANPQGDVSDKLLSLGKKIEETLN